jgi:hypothetical protein
MRDPAGFQDDPKLQQLKLLTLVKDLNLQVRRLDGNR